MPQLPVLTPVRDPSADLLRQLANAVEGEVRLGVHDRMLYATDASLYQVEPLGVVIPAGVADAVRAIRLCGQNRIPILPRGGGTSLAGQCTNRAVVIDVSANCRAVSDLDNETKTITVEPGITVDDLNDRLSESGFFFAPDPATSRQANIGGCIGNNAAGARSILFGRTSENVIAIRAALITGEVVDFRAGASFTNAKVRELTLAVCSIVAQHAAAISERFPKTVRRNAGYGLDMILAQMKLGGWMPGDRLPLLDADAAHDPAWLRQVNLAHLLCGSEGTLAVTLGATLQLRPKPAARGLAVLGFADLDESIAAVLPILETRPSAVELLDDTVIDLARANAEYSRYVDLMPQPQGTPLKAVLYVEYFGASEAEVAAKISALRARLPNVPNQWHTNAAAMLNAWKLRKAGEPLLHGVAGHRKPITFVEDNAIPVERLSEFVSRLRALVESHGTRAAFYAHASVGVLHVRPLIDIHDENDRRIMREIAVATADLARELGGVMSGEHGDGRVRGPLLERYFGPELMDAFRDVKALFDPNNLLNPGNIVEARPIESITSLLRVEPTKGRPLHFPPGLETYFDYTDQHGFDGAVEMCNGAGVCRKKQGGTMCPSYMATLDERHSTRGRGNALRLAITGQLTPSDNTAARWADPETIETLDLCLSCKACKTECPSNVDISRLKSEYTAQRFRTKPPSLATRLMGAVRLLNRVGSMTPNLANRVNALSPVRKLIGRVLNLHPSRTIPKFSAPLDRLLGKSTANHARPAVMLFGDCFSMYNESQIGVAAAKLLESFGYRVVLANAGCCGRAKISMGLLPAAANEIESTITRLEAAISQHKPAAVLFLEPSCLSAVKDDWKQLKLSIPIARRNAIASLSWLVDDFLERAWEAHPSRPNFDLSRISGRVLLHGHCHQKALWSIETSSKLLARVVGNRVTSLDTGCCGMAGSFGYTKDRFEVSMKIGELALFPAARAMQPGDVLLAPGTSCRHQVHDGTTVTAVHPVEFLASLLSGGVTGVRSPVAGS